MQGKIRLADRDKRDPAFQYPLQWKTERRQGTLVLVRATGLEPARNYSLASETSASAYSAMPAQPKLYHEEAPKIIKKL